MTEYTQFASMTRRETKAYLERFLAETPDALERLVVTSEAGGGPSRSDLDFTRESLDPWWEWIRDRVSWRAGYVEVPRGQPNPWRPTDLEPPDELPSWFYHPSGVGMERLSTESLWLVDGLARYLGEVMIRNLPGVGWASGSTRPRGNYLASKPVLTGFDQEFSPVISTCMRAITHLTTDHVGPPAMSEFYDMWAGSILK